MRGRVELYLPWPGFEAGSWREADPREVRVSVRPSIAAYALAARFHAGWEGLADDARRLLARDGHEVLGGDLRSPAALVLCWTADGTVDGTGEGADGTRQALRIADGHGIAVLNLALPEHVRRIAEPPAGAV